MGHGPLPGNARNYHTAALYPHPIIRFSPCVSIQIPPNQKPTLYPVRNKPPSQGLPAEGGPVSFTNGATAPRTKPKSRDKASFTSGLCRGLSADSLGWPNKWGVSQATPWTRRASVEKARFCSRVRRDHQASLQPSLCLPATPLVRHVLWRIWRDL